MTDNKVRFLACKPIISVKDVSASLDYYCNKLGFTKVFSWKDGVGFCSYGELTFAEVRCGDASIMLSVREQVGKGMWIYMDMGDSAEIAQLYQEFEERGALIVEPPNDKPWDMREMLVKDLDDNFLRIGAPLKR